METQLQANQEAAPQTRPAKAKPELTERWFKPATDVIERADSFELVLEMPGVPKDKVEVKVEEGLLRVRGEIAWPKELARQEEALRRHRDHYGRSFRLDRDLDPDRIQAKMEQGVLTLTLAKRAQAAPRQIEVG